MAVAPLHVGYRVPVREAQLGPIIHITQRLELWAPPRQPVVHKTSLIIFLILLFLPRRNFSAGGCRSEGAEAPRRRPRALHAPDVVGVLRQSFTLVVCLPDDSRHVTFKVPMGARPRWGVNITARVTCLHFSACVSGVVVIGCISGVVWIGGVLMVVVVVM